MPKTLITVLILILSIAWAKDLKLSGDTYFNYALANLENNSFGISRAYFTFENKVSESVSYKFQTDVGAGGATDYSLFLKNAKLDWRTALGKFSFGLQGMNMFKIQEHNWGYRFIEKSAMDKHKYSSSADMGIGWKKSFGAVTSGLMITNGTGYKKHEDDQYKKLSLNLLYGSAKLKKGFNTGVAFSYEQKDYELMGSDTTEETGNITVVAGFAAWSGGPLKVGAEVAVLTRSFQIISSRNLISNYINYKFGEKLSAYGRLDINSAETTFDKYIILGASYQPEKALYIAPNLRVDIPDGEDPEITYAVNLRFKI